MQASTTATSPTENNITNTKHYDNDNDNADILFSGSDQVLHNAGLASKRIWPIKN